MYMYPIVIWSQGSGYICVYIVWELPHLCQREHNFNFVGNWILQGIQVGTLYSPDAAQPLRIMISCIAGLKSEISLAKEILQPLWLNRGVHQYLKNNTTVIFTLRRGLE